MWTLGITGSTLLVIIGIWAHSFSLIPDLFRLNKECQEEGYYMGEFEFKMLGFAYYLDKGQYAKAVSGIRKLHKQLKTREGLTKVPHFNDKRQELEFYLNLQNPRTGAFMMDDTYPYCTYEGPTGNVLLHLEALAKETGQPLRLKYPLKFYDEINTPEKLKAYLNDLAYIGWIASKLPESSFHIVRDLASYASDKDVVNRHNLYSFSPEWKKTLLQWLYENQDPETGFWGPRSGKNGRLWKLDLHNTGSIVKAFVDSAGNNIHASLPLQYKDKMFATTLKVMSEPPPKDADLDEWHGWTLKRWKGVMLLTRYLWKDASTEDKVKARKSFEEYVRIKFESYYLPEQGAFGYYPHSKLATLDGTEDGISGLKLMGALSPEKQRRLWGGPEETCIDLGNFVISSLSDKDLARISALPDINSVRCYGASPDSGHLTIDVTMVFYPKTTPVLDIMELVPKIKSWLDTTSQSMGNWVSREGLLSDFENIRMEPVSVSRGGIPLKQLNETLEQNKTLYVIGFDVLQIPRFKVVYRLVK